MATVDSKIGDLPRAKTVDDDSLLIMEQQGAALAVEGKLIADFARESVDADIERAVKAANDAEQAVSDAQSHADRAEAIRNSFALDEAKLAQAVSDAAGSAASAQTSADNAARIVTEAAAEVVAEANEFATIAQTSADNAAQSAADAEESANRAQAEADRATIPAVSGVYNVVLTDRVTAERYALIVENGRLSLLGVSESLDSAEVNLIDNTTGTAYAVVVESGKLILEEV